MKIDSAYTSVASLSTTTSVSANKALEEKLDAKSITNSYLAQYQLQVEEKSKETFSFQADTFTLADIGYNGKPIAELTQMEAKELVSEDGFFGIEQTSQRIADFVLNGAGDDVEKLRAGREGILRGFKEAEEIWGETLPDISYQTINKAVSQIDEKLASLGANVLEVNA
ncbi:MAG: hypothetical protein PWQ42_602 [Sulfurospirillum sp.]|jgi:hypothetical protein|nr:hypothetical protein [Sulfurospirillum sp.]DAB33512.1 MAG TPA: hydrogenase [Sulfurospirillum sp. UBA12182]